MDKKHVLSVLNRLAVWKPGQAVLLEEALQGRLSVLAEAVLDVAIETGAPVSQAAARLLEAEPDPDLAERLARRGQDELLGDALPLRELLLVARRITLEARRTAWRDPDDKQKARLALMAHNLAISLGRQGDAAGAAQALQEAIDLLREVAVHHPRGVQLALAKGLFNLASFLSDLDRHEEAISMLDESRRISEELVREESSAEALAVLASGLSSLGSRLSDVGRYEEALMASRESIEIFRHFPSVATEALRSSFALGLERLGRGLTADGRPREALAATEEANQILRSLAERFPEIFLPDLARNLLTLSERLAAVGRREDAMRASQEALQIYRGFSQRQVPFAPELADSFHNLGNHLADVGCHEQALEVTREAVDRARGLVSSQVAGSRLRLARALNALGNCLGVLNRGEEALAAFREAVWHLQELGREKPEEVRRSLAMGLRNLGMQLRGLGEREEAIRITREAVGLYRELGLTLPGAFLPHLAINLNNLGLMLRDLGQTEEALGVTWEAVRTFRQLAERGTEDFRPDLAMGLHNLGVLLSDIGNREEALEVTLEATALFRELALDPPEISGSRGVFVEEMQSGDGDLQAARESADRYRLTGTPNSLGLHLSNSLFNLGRRLIELKRCAEAVHAFEESARHLRPYCEAHPATFGDQMQAVEWSLRDAARQAGAAPPAEQQVDEDHERKRTGANVSNQPLLP
jgi:tetratricopeptide (TPR) repeat protein